MRPITPKRRKPLKQRLCGYFGHGSLAKHTLNETDYYLFCERCSQPLTGVLSTKIDLSSGRVLGTPMETRRVGV